MAVSESDRDWESEFEQLTSHVDFDEGLPDPSTVTSVALLDEGQLIERATRAKLELQKLGEVLNPRTDRGRELHSERAAYMVEMAKRGMRG